MFIRLFMDDNSWFYYLHKGMTVIQKPETSSTHRKEMKDEEPEMCISIAKTCLFGILFLIPISWPFLIYYFMCRSRQCFRRVHDSESPPELNAFLNDEFIVMLEPGVDGVLQYKLDDDKSFRSCQRGYKFPDLSVGHHNITFKFIPTVSSIPISQKSYNFPVHPTIVCSFSTERDTTTMTLKTKQDIDGAFHYRVDNNESFQSCSSEDTPLKLLAGVYNIEVKFIPTDFPDLSVSENHELKIKSTAYSSISVNEDTATIELHSNADGEFNCFLDGSPLQKCYDGYTTDELSVGHHCITCQFILTGSSDPLYQERFNFLIHPTIVCAVTTKKDTATLNVETKQNVDGTFLYLLNNNEKFQPCSLGHTLSKLSAGVHHIVFKFVPTKLSDSYVTKKEYQFKIEPTAHGSVSIDEDEKDTATVELYSNTKGLFKCSLDEAPFQQCNSGKKFSRLSAGHHKITFCFIVASTSAEITQLPVEFTVDQIANVSVSVMEGNTTIKLYCNFSAKFQYSVDENEFQLCSSEEKLPKLTAGLHHVKVQFIPTVPSPDLQKVIEKSENFMIPIIAMGSVTIRKDIAVFDLTTNTDGVFQYSLDAQEYEQFNAAPYKEGLQETPRLSAGDHSLRIQFVTNNALSSETVELHPLINFTILSKDLYPSHCQPVSLQNVGNTCFFNSALQSVLKTDVFHHLCLQWDHVQKFYVSNMPLVSNHRQHPEVILEPYTKMYEVKSKTNDAPLNLSVQLTPGPLTEAWIHLFTNISTRLSLVHVALLPEDLLEQLGKRNSRFVQGTQEDSHEALRCLFDAIKNEEIEQVKKKIKEQFGVTGSQTEASLDGEEKLKLKGYLRMASKVPTIIGQVIEGKNISVTICHECLDVVENEESFFDISLPIPDETLDKFDNAAAACALGKDKMNTSYCDDCQLNNNRDLEDVGSNQADSSTKANVDASEHATNKLEWSQTNTSPMVSDEESRNNNVSQVPENFEEHQAASVNQQHMPPNTDEQHSALQDNTQPITVNDRQSNAPESSEGSDTGMGNSPAVSPSGITTTKEENFDQKSQQGTEKTASDPAKLPASPEAKQEDQGTHHDNVQHQDNENYEFRVTNYKSHFQEYLIKKGLNHQPKGRQNITNDLQLCLSSYTDLDVLDEDNKFICKACTAQKQLTSMDDEPALCRVSKQLMIHQLPPILILHMKRFEIGFYEVTKDDRHISFPEVLDMAPYCTSKCIKEMGDLNGRILYGLYAVAVHQGKGLRSGHYVAYVKTRPTEEKNLDKGEYHGYDKYYHEGYCKKGQWYFTNDMYVRECSFDEVKESKAYMLFYEQLPSIPATVI